jgi:hypothetical protein
MQGLFRGHTAGRPNDRRHHEGMDCDIANTDTAADQELT